MGKGPQLESRENARTLRGTDYTQDCPRPKCCHSSQHSPHVSVCVCGFGIWSQPNYQQLLELEEMLILREAKVINIFRIWSLYKSKLFS